MVQRTTLEECHHIVLFTTTTDTGLLNPHRHKNEAAFGYGYIAALIYWSKPSTPSPTKLNIPFSGTLMGLFNSV